MRELKQKMIVFENQLPSIRSSFAIIEFTPHGEILTANQNFLDIMGYSLCEVQGKHHRIFVTDAQAASTEYIQFWQLLGQGQFISGEFNRIDKNGKVLQIKGSYNPIVGKDGRLHKIVKYAYLIGQLRIDQVRS